MSLDHPNPYAAPNPVKPLGGPQPYYGPPQQSPWITQIMVVSILMFVQAGFEILMGLLSLVYVAMFGFMGTSIINSGNRPVQRPDQPPPELIFGLIAVGFGVVCLICIFSGALRIYAGVNNIKHRRRTLGIVSLCFGAITALTFYCLPTSIGLLIYGLIIYLNPEVKRAFDANGG